MKVVCIESQQENLGIKFSLTKGKTYDVLDEPGVYYRILDDTNSDTYYLKTRFIPIDIQRENLLNDLLK
jgi:hypothetical protein